MKFTDLKFGEIYKVENTINNFWFIGEFVGVEFEFQYHKFRVNSYQYDGFYTKHEHKYKITKIG